MTEMRLGDELGSFVLKSSHTCTSKLKHIRLICLISRSSESRKGDCGRSSETAKAHRG
eukprot:TRINITY_DN8125_c0_g1_i1.p1 TRINITY_DN8125_c0_g1~~TRINITY_DN8125_c0_g1_i1.p1  ORF type:complete len:58 (-),score=7.53 TRINITY_DN8125_c0_g1_i1:3-176(-)